MRILYAATELYPLLKTGGLADVSAALPPALIRLGVDVRLFLPGFPSLREALIEQQPVASLGAAFGASDARIIRGKVPDSGVPAYLLDAPELFDRPGNPYVDDNGVDYPDNHRRFALFGWAASRLRDGDWMPDVVHAHDWHAGLAPAWLATIGGLRPASVFTIHNLAFQGIVPASQVPELGLPARFFDVDGIEYYGSASFMKAGLYFADKLTTVSPTYADEIQRAPQGMGFEGLLAAREHDLLGILNGVNVEVWNPATDINLTANYDADDPMPKAKNKAALQRELGLAEDPDALLCCLVSRLTEQKGLDLVVAGLPTLFEQGGQLALLGTGERSLEDTFRRAAADHPTQVGVRIGYDEALSHRLIGSADVILVPSRYEPCGLTQLYGLRYGTLPMVTAVGGLADTVVDATPPALADDSATGFVLEDATPPAFIDTLARALASFREPAEWAQLRGRAMTMDFSWEESAGRYADLYRSLIARPTG